MKIKLLPSLLASLALAAALPAQVPQMISYQGRILVGNANFNGNGQFKFALVDGAGATTFWSNDGTSVAGSEPAAAIAIDVNKGLYSVLLGDAALPNMTAIPYSVFDHPDVRLRVWFDNGQAGFQQFVPDQRVTAVGYAMMAADVPDSAITGAKLANAAVTSVKLADGAVTGAKLAPSAVGNDQLANFIELGSAAANGRLDVFRTAVNTRAIRLDGMDNLIAVYGDDGDELGRFTGAGHGELLLRDSNGHQIATRLTANGNSGGRLYLYNSNGVTRALVSGENAGGVITLYQADGSGTGALLDGNNGEGAGQLTLYQGDGHVGAALYGDDSNGSGALSLRKANGDPGLRLYGGPTSGSFALYNNAGELNLWGYSYGGQEGVLSVRNHLGNETIYLWGRDSGDTASGQIGLKESDGTETLTLQAAEVAGNGAQIVLRKSDGTATVVLDADQGGEGRVTTQVLQITGGSDLSEQFDVNAARESLRPGLVVAIDPENPGELKLATQAYDRTVAGVLSGAGGVKPGMLMGQAGTAADGKYPVALTGRVYCQVDASHGPVRPGDLLTTSETPGHAMKVTDHARAAGAILGKAMTGLESGKGLVLVLVSLQ